jgi:hypothetical protein
MEGLPLVVLAMNSRAFRVVTHVQVEVGSGIWPAADKGKSIGVSMKIPLALCFKRSRNRLDGERAGEIIAAA